MSAAPLTSSNLHDPVLPLVRPVALTLKKSQTVSDAHSVVRVVPDACDIPYFYVVDDHHRLAGLVPAGHLLTAPLEHRVEQVMSPGVIAIPSWATVLIASEYFATKKLKAFPVIHADGTLVGTLDVSLFTGQIISVAQETYDEIFQLIGIHATSMRTPWTSYLDRFPWLLSNMTGGLLCAFIASRFEDLLQQTVVLALFIPVVLALAESVSMQSATLTLQGLSDDSPKPRRLFTALWREIRTAVLLGLSFGSLVGLVVLAWRRDPPGAAVIGSAIGGSILIACVLGVLIPTFVRRFKADPRIAAGPLVLAMTDLMTLMSYLWLGSRMLGR